MKIDFSILWVDDNKDFVNALQPQLNKWMDDHGLGLTIYWHPGEAGVYADLAKQEVELIVLDYKLKGGKKGDSIISEIRGKGFLEDIVFYTQDAVPNDIFTVSPNGVFFSNREDAKDLIKNLISVKIRRASDLATLRGWFVADSIELESLMVKILSKYFEKHKDIAQERAMKVLSEDGSFFFGRLKEFLSEILKPRMDELTLTERGIFDFGAKHTILNGLLKDHISLLNKTNSDRKSVPKLEVCKKILDTFPKEIIGVRNTLAHQIAEVAETGHKKLKTKTKEAKEIIITPDECIAIRKSVRKHLDNLLALEDLV